MNIPRHAAWIIAFAFLTSCASLTQPGQHRMEPATPNPNGATDYYAVAAEGGVEGLTQTFVDITTHLVRSCEVELDSGSHEKKLVNVAVDCAIVPFEDGAGWDIDPANPTTLVLAGDSCERVSREGARRIDVVYGCPTVK